MSSVYFVEVVLLYIAILVFIVGVVYKIWKWATAPKNLPWGLFPAPSLAGQIKEIVLENVIQKSVLEYNRALWPGTWCLHMGINFTILAMVLLILGFTFGLLFKISWMLMLIGAVYLLTARSALKHVRILSTSVSYFNLLLLLSIAACFAYIDLSNIVGAVHFKKFLLGVLTFKPVLINQPAFIVNLILLEFFLVYMPFSAMMHVISKFFTFHTIKWTHR